MEGPGAVRIYFSLTINIIMNILLAMLINKNYIISSYHTVYHTIILSGGGNPQDEAGGLGAAAP